MTRHPARIGRIDPIDSDLDLENEMDLDSEDNQEDNLDLDNNFLDGGSFFEGENDSTLKKHEELLKSLTNFKPVIRDMVNSWVGKVWDAEQKKYIQSSLIDRKMNEKGAAFYSGFLSTYAKQTNIITNLDIRQSTFLQKEIIEAVFLTLAEKMEEFEIKSTGDMLIIANEIIHTAFLVLYGAEDGKYNNLLSQTTQRHENISYSNPMGMGGNMNQMPRKKRGFFSSLRMGLTGGD